MAPPLDQQLREYIVSWQFDDKKPARELLHWQTAQKLQFIMSFVYIACSAQSPIHIVGNKEDHELWIKEIWAIYILCYMRFAIASHQYLHSITPTLLCLPNREKKSVAITAVEWKDIDHVSKESPYTPKRTGLCKAAHFLNFEGRHRRWYQKCSWSPFCNMMAVWRADSRARRLIGNTDHEGECNNERRETTERPCKDEDIDVSSWCDFVKNMCCSFFSNVWQVQTNFCVPSLQFFMQITVPYHSFWITFDVCQKHPTYI